jgi:hypothetical protein
VFFLLLYFLLLLCPFLLRTSSLQFFSLLDQISATNDDPNSDDPTFSLTTILGRSEDIQAQLLARRLVDNISESTPRSLLVSVALRKDLTTEDLRNILKFVLLHKIW